MSGGLPAWQREGRSAVFWSWYCSPRRANGRSWGRKNIGTRGYNHTRSTFGEYPGWRVLVSHPHARYGTAGGRSGARRKVHLVRDQIVAKHKWHPEQRLTRWICGAYTFEGILLVEADMVCSKCLLVSTGRRVTINDQN